MAYPKTTKLGPKSHRRQTMTFDLRLLCFRDELLKHWLTVSPSICLFKQPHKRHVKPKLNMHSIFRLTRSVFEYIRPSCRLLLRLIFSSNFFPRLPDDLFTNSLPKFFLCNAFEKDEAAEFNIEFWGGGPTSVRAEFYNGREEGSTPSAWCQNVWPLPLFLWCFMHVGSLCVSR